MTVSVTSTDEIDPNPTVICTPPSGSVFPIGTTSVTCVARDVSGNNATASFRVHVKNASEQLRELFEDILSNELGPGRSLTAKLEPLAAVGDGDQLRVCNVLGAFVREVRAQSGKQIPGDRADGLGRKPNSERARMQLMCSALMGAGRLVTRRDTPDSQHARRRESWVLLERGHSARCKPALFAVR